MRPALGTGRRAPRGRGVRSWMVTMVIFAAMLSPVEALGEDIEGETGSTDRQQDPILIRADRMEMRRQENLALYTGHVQASQRDYRLESRRLELEWEPERNKVTRLVARGEVKLFTEEGTATAGLAVLDVASKAIVMTGSPRLLRGEELVEGDRIIYSIPDKKSTVLGGKGGRVKTRLVPGSRR